MGRSGCAAPLVILGFRVYTGIVSITTVARRFFGVVPEPVTVITEFAAMMQFDLVILRIPFCVEAALVAIENMDTAALAAPPCENTRTLFAFPTALTFA